MTHCNIPGLDDDEYFNLLCAGIEGLPENSPVAVEDLDVFLHRVLPLYKEILTSD